MSGSEGSWSNGEWPAALTQGTGQDVQSLRVYDLGLQPEYPADPVVATSDRILRYALEVGQLFLELRPTNRRCLRVRTCNRELRAEVDYLEVDPGAVIERFKAIAGFAASKKKEDEPESDRQEMAFICGPIRRRAEVRMVPVSGGEVLKVFLYDL